LGESVAKDVARVQAVRRALGSDIDIMADVNTRYTILDLQRALPALEECGLFWLEEPFPPDAVADYAHFNGKASIPIAGGENHYLRFQARQLLETGAVSIIQPDPCKCGGITESKKIADMASAYRRFYAPHISSTMIDGAACVHLLCATPNGLIYEADLSPINPFRDELVAQGPRVVDGYIDPGDAPGLGITIDETLFDKYPGIAGPGTV